MDCNHARLLLIFAHKRNELEATEAERLLAMCPDADETIVRLALCLAFAFLALPHLHEFFTTAAHTLGSLLPSVAAQAHHALACMGRWFGGLS